MTKGNKKGHAGLIIFILILVLVIGGGTGFYFYQRQQPRKAVENFLDSMKKMDFNAMESISRAAISQHWTMQISAMPHTRISSQKLTKR